MEVSTHTVNSVGWIMSECTLWLMIVIAVAQPEKKTSSGQHRKTAVARAALMNRCRVPFLRLESKGSAAYKEDSIGAGRVEGD